MTPGWRLGPLLAPRSIAIIGASEAADSWAPGDRAFAPPHRVRRAFCTPVNPKYDTVWGVPACRRSADLPRRRRPGRLRGPRAPRGAMIDDCARAGCPVGDGRLVGVRRGGRRGPRASGAAAGGGAPPSPARARSQRRGVRELRRPRGAGRTTPPADPVAGIDQRDLAVGNRGLDDEPDGVGPRRRPADHPGRGQRGGARSRRPLLVGGRRPAHEGRHVLRGDDARRGGDRARPRRAPIRGEAGADLRAAGPLRGGPARDRRAHGGARREHRVARRLAARVTGSSWWTTP